MRVLKGLKMFCLQMAVYLVLMATVYSQIQVHGSRDTYYVHSTSEDTSGRCTCTVLAPSPDVCSDDAKYHYIKDLEAQVANLTTLVHQLANRTSSALDIQTTMTLIHSLTSQLDVLEADRQLLLTEHFSSIRDEIQALAGLLPQLQVDSADALLLQIYHTQLSNLSAVLSDLEEQHGLSTAELQLQVMQLTEQLNNCNASKYENPCEKKPCHINAACFHHGESFSCVCLAGYTGDGFYCQATDPGIETTGPVATITTTASTTTTPEPQEIGWLIGDSIVNSDWSAGFAGDDITGDCDDQPGQIPWPDLSSFPFPINNAQCGNSSQVGQAITNEASYNGSQSWHYKRGRGGVLTGGSGTPFSPGLETKVGRSDGDYEGEADSFYASFRFKAVKEADPFTGGDKSRIMVAAGNPNGTAPASNYLEIYYEQNRRKLVQVRTRESSPSYAQCSATRDCGDDFGFTYTIVATDLDPTEWHHVEMTLRTSTVDYQDDWYYVVDGVASSETHGAYFKTQQYDEGRYEYVNRLNIAVQHVPSVSREGFYFDDIYYKAFNWAQPDVIIDEYSTSFEEMG